MTNSPEPVLPRIRRAALPPDVRVVMRGMSDDEPGVSIRQAAQFRRRYPDFGRFGISGFAARDDDEVADLGAHHLDRFAVLNVFELADVLAAALKLWQRPEVLTLRLRSSIRLKSRS